MLVGLLLSFWGTWYKSVDGTSLNDVLWKFISLPYGPRQKWVLLILVIDSEEGQTAGHGPLFGMWEWATHSTCKTNSSRAAMESVAPVSFLLNPLKPDPA